MTTIKELLKIAVLSALLALVLECACFLPAAAPRLASLLAGATQTIGQIQRDAAQLQQIETTVQSDLETVQPVLENAGKSGKVPIKLLAKAPGSH